MSIRFSRPTAGYDGNVALSNYQKYQTDSAASPKVAISSVKMDGDINYLIAAVNSLDDDISSLVAGTIPDDSVTNAKLRNSSATSVIGRSANTTGDPADIQATSNNTVLLRRGNTLQFNTISADELDTNAVTSSKIIDDAVTTSKIVDGAVTTSKLTTIADYRVLGNVSGISATPSELILYDEDDMATDSATGLVTQQSVKAYVDGEITTVNATIDALLDKRYYAGAISGGTLTELGSSGMSVSRTAAGTFTVTLSPAMADANYSVCMSGGSTGTQAIGYVNTGATKNTTTFSIIYRNPGSGTAADLDYISIQVVGDPA